MHEINDVRIVIQRILLNKTQKIHELKVFAQKLTIKNVHKSDSQIHAYLVHIDQEIPVGDYPGYNISC